MRKILTLCCLVTLCLAGCTLGGGGGEPAMNSGNPCGDEACQWPGGSLGGWSESDGPRESWDRSHAPSETGMHDGRTSSGGEYTPSEPSDEGSAGEFEGGAGGAGGGGFEGGAGGAGGAGGGGGFEEHYDESGGPDPTSPRHEAPALEGGEIDDNDDLEAFITYAEAMVDSDVSIHWLDVSTRHYIRVIDRNGRHVPDATVILESEERLVAGRTRSDGQFAFFPLAYGGPTAYTITVDTGFGEGEGVLDGETTEIQLNGVRPDVDQVDVDVAFVIDATGSMSEEISRIKATITDIANRISETEGVANLRFGLVDYRDRGDDYVTHSVDFTDDIEAFREIISQVEAQGGGDFPEDLNSALRETMRRLDWRHENTLRMVFVVADAPAHHYEQAAYTYDQAMRDAAVMGIRIFPIASGGSDPTAEFQFRQMAQFSQGHFIFITEGGGSSSGSGGSEYHVDENQFRVERLDDLLVRLVREEIEAWLAGIVALPL